MTPAYVFYLRVLQLGYMLAQTVAQLYAFGWALVGIDAFRRRLQRSLDQRLARHLSRDIAQLDSELDSVLSERACEEGLPPPGVPPRRARGKRARPTP